MADNKPKEVKPGGKTGETLLGMLGALGSIAGPLLTGQNIDFGTPFKLGAAYFQDRRMTEDLKKVLDTNPHTAGMTDDITAAMDQGGLPGILNNLGAQQAPDPNALAPNLMGQPQQNPNSLSLTPGFDQVVNQTPAPQPAQNTPIDYQSDAFLQKLTNFRPDIAEKVLQARATQSPEDPINSILKTLALRDYQSPEAKQQTTFDKMEKMDELIASRQEEAKQETARLGREKWGVTEAAALTSATDAQNSMLSMLDRVNSGIYPTLAEKAMSDNATISGTYTTLKPDREPAIQLARDMNKMVMSVVKQQSGVQYGYRELQWIKATQPSKWDSPEMFANGVRMALNTSKLNQMGMIIKKAERSENVEVALREGMTLEQIKAWKHLTKQLATRDSSKGEMSVFMDPKNAKLFQVLGMQQITDSKGLQ